MKIMQCDHCGNQAVLLNDSGVLMECCGDTMRELVAGTTDAALEKHVPAVVSKDNTLLVSVGEVPHPMQKEHFIQWIAVEQGDKVQITRMHPERDAKAVFASEPGAYAAYEYCNLHGLWKAEGQA